jgi:hypothetical protein
VDPQAAAAVTVRAIGVMAAEVRADLAETAL